MPFVTFGSLQMGKRNLEEKSKVYLTYTVAVLGAQILGLQEIFFYTV